jgi:hypothetical protein
LRSGGDQLLLVFIALRTQFVLLGRTTGQEREIQGEIETM